jgi:CsoR family transcriptional regulator, copper-sensing transcriptional repressor
MSHPSHKKLLPRLNRARGQVDGVIRMVEAERYCIDLLTQIRAARAALLRVEQEVLQTHLRACLADALASGDAEASAQKVDELATVLKRFGS